MNQKKTKTMNLLHGFYDHISRIPLPYFDTYLFR